MGILDSTYSLNFDTHFCAVCILLGMKIGLLISLPPSSGQCQPLRVLDLVLLRHWVSVDIDTGVLVLDKLLDSQRGRWM